MLAVLRSVLAYLQDCRSTLPSLSADEALPGPDSAASHFQEVTEGESETMKEAEMEGCEDDEEEDMDHSCHWSHGS